MKNPENLLLVADSERDANMLYAVGMFVPDPFIYLRLRGREIIVMSDLEIDRARVQAAHCRVVSLTQRQQRLRRVGVAAPGFAHVIHDLLRNSVRQVWASRTISARPRGGTGTATVRPRCASWRVSRTGIQPKRR